MDKEKNLLRYCVTLVLISAILLLSNSTKSVFANQDIQMLLTSWFDKKSEKAMASMEEAISIEREIQMTKLKEEVSKNLAQADKELEEFSENEIELRKAELYRYTTALIQEAEFDTEEQEEAFLKEVDEIIRQTKMKLEDARSNLLKTTE
ncbi:hypothetical protein ACFVAD_16090 [Sutcliffiella sp. NPDC057660]|uniref:hypothetical protein n=1 Tax=Sutcliffiella sp. NPDC057660 TaxID=3346199 RepID=UPI0036B6121A